MCSTPRSWATDELNMPAHEPQARAAALRASSSTHGSWSPASFSCYDRTLIGFLPNYYPPVGCVSSEALPPTHKQHPFGLLQGTATEPTACRCNSSSSL